MIMKDDFISSMLFVALVLSMATAWYFAWVKPNTERMYSIMDCMTEINDHTEHGYAECASRLNEVG